MRNTPSFKPRLRAPGYFTTFQPIREPADRIVCASMRFRCDSPTGWGLGGNSFWVAKRGGEWFIATWSPVIYRVADPSRLVELCVRLLQREPGGAYAEFDEPVQTDFGLVETPEDRFPD